MARPLVGKFDPTLGDSTQKAVLNSIINSFNRKGIRNYCSVASKVRTTLYYLTT